MRWFMDLSYPLMKAMRSRQAVEAGHRPATGMGFEELRNATTRVLVVPCTFRGKPRGAAAEGIARELSGAEAERAFELIKSNWGAVMSPYERGLDLLGVPEVYVEVVPVGRVEDAEEVSGRSGMLPDHWNARVDVFWRDVETGA
jgi:hypothetical protein